MRIITVFSVILLGIVLVAMNQSSSRDNITIPPSPTYQLGREPIELPLNYREQFVHYATVERSDGVIRHLYISPQAIQSILNGEELPERTMVIIEAYRPIPDNPSMHYLDPEVHVAESRSTWQIADLAASSRVGTWNFGAFNAENGQPITDTALNDCFSCHESVSSRNFLFSNPQLEAYAQTGKTQYSYCPRAGRAICR